METREFKGKLDATGRKFAVVVSRFNDLVGKQLLAGALDCLERHNARAVDIVWVSGAFEIPATALRLASAKKCDAIIALGAVIRGDTPHAEYISAEVAKGLAHVYLKTGVPAKPPVILIPLRPACSKLFANPKSESLTLPPARRMFCGLRSR